MSSTAYNKYLKYRLAEPSDVGGKERLARVIADWKSYSADAKKRLKHELSKNPDMDKEAMFAILKGVAKGSAGVRRGTVACDDEEVELKEEPLLIFARPTGVTAKN